MAFKHTGHSKSSRTLLETVPLGLREVGAVSFTNSLTSVDSSFWGGSTSDLLLISSKNGLLVAMLVKAITSSPVSRGKKDFIGINQEGRNQIQFVVILLAFITVKIAE